VSELLRCSLKSVNDDALKEELRLISGADGVAVDILK
jgi:hypothetical protein